MSDYQMSDEACDVIRKAIEAKAREFLSEELASELAMDVLGEVQEVLEPAFEADAQELIAGIEVKFEIPLPRGDGDVEIVFGTEALGPEENETRRMKLSDIIIDCAAAINDESMSAFFNEPRGPKARADFVAFLRRMADEVERNEP